MEQSTSLSLGLRERRNILIQAQQQVLIIDEGEDRLEHFLSKDRPAYQNLLERRFASEVEALTQLEQELNARTTAFNAAVAVAKLKNLSMKNAWAYLHAEETRFSAGDDEARAEITRERETRARSVREDLEREFRARVFTPPAADTPSSLKPGGMENEKLKLAYRRLVRRLHPDLQGPQIDVTEARWQRRIWHLSQVARETGDLTQLEVLFKVSLLRQMELSELTREDALTVKTWLSKEVERVQAELHEAEGDPAWGFSYLEARAQEARVRESLAREAQFLKAELEALKTQEQDEAREATVAPPRLRTRRTRGPRADERQLSLFDAQNA